MPDLDHRFVRPPYLYLMDRRVSPSGDRGELWHLRVSQPNVGHIPPPVRHSTEHFLIHLLRAASSHIVLAAPMGCDTGFYISALGENTWDSIAAQVADALTIATKVMSVEVV